MVGEFPFCHRSRQPQSLSQSKTQKCLPRVAVLKEVVVLPRQGPGRVCKGSPTQCLPVNPQKDARKIKPQVKEEIKNESGFLALGKPGKKQKPRNLMGAREPIFAKTWVFPWRFKRKPKGLRKKRNKQTGLQGTPIDLDIFSK